MQKKVNIYPRGPITSVNPPIRVPVRGVTKDVKDIRRCIIAGAKVEEIIPTGTIVLNLQNYDIDNTEAPTIQMAKNAKPVEEKSAEPAAYSFNRAEAPKEAQQILDASDKVKEDIKVAEEKMVEQEQSAPADDEAAVEETQTPVVEEKTADPYQGMTKRQRRALRRAEELKAVETANTEEPVETVDAEAE